jgi:hypothetical protein
MTRYCLALLATLSLGACGCTNDGDDDTTQADDDDTTPADDDDDATPADDDDTTAGDDDDATPADDDDTTAADDDDDTTPAPCNGLVAGDVVFGNVEYDPVAVDDLLGEWFMLQNTTAGSVNLQGFVLYDQGSDYHTINASVPIAPGAGVVLGINADINTNGGIPVDYEYTDITLADGGDELILECDGVVIDEVNW